MARTDVLKDALLATQAYDVIASHGALFTSDPGTSGTAVGELTSGGYARVALPWSAPAAGLVPGERAITTAAVNFNIPAGVTVTHAATCSSASGSTVLDVVALVPTFTTPIAAVLPVTFTSNEGG